MSFRLYAGMESSLHSSRSISHGAVHNPQIFPPPSFFFITHHPDHTSQYCLLSLTGLQGHALIRPPILLFTSQHLTFATYYEMMPCYPTNHIMNYFKASQCLSASGLLSNLLSGLGNGWMRPHYSFLLHIHSGRPRRARNDYIFCLCSLSFSLQAHDSSLCFLLPRALLV